MTVTFNIHQLAAGWLSVSEAAGKDKEQPMLYRAVRIEEFATGARLVATDGIMLLSSWVPAEGVDDTDGAEPSLDEVPDAVATAMDVDLRARSLFAYLHSTDHDTVDPDTVSVTLGVYQPDEAGSFGFDLESVAISYPGRERLLLRIYDDAWPDWRALAGRFKSRRADYVALNPEVVARLAKVAKLHGNKPLVWRWGGEEQMAAVELRGANPAVTGLVMPVRIADEASGDHEQAAA